MGHEELENTIAQSLMAIGLYTISFEATALSFRAKIHEYIVERDRSQLSRFTKACGTAYNTFDFCGPILLENGVIGQGDLESLNDIRMRRNLFAHNGYNRVFDLRVQEVLPDVKQLHVIAQKVLGWSILVHEATTESRCDLRKTRIRLCELHGCSCAQSHGTVSRVQVLKSSPRRTKSSSEIVL
jgi:hypothetical protein